MIFEGDEDDDGDGDVSKLAILESLVAQCAGTIDRNP
jgi:hypothetical protein